MKIETAGSSCIHRSSSYNHSIYLLSFGVIWLLASIIGQYRFENLAIIFLFLGTGLFNIIYQIVQQALSVCRVADKDPLPMIISCMTMAVPIGIIFGFLPFIGNINAFFHAFGILFGLVFLVAAVVYKLPGYYILSFFLLSGEIGLGIYYDSFTIGGYYAGGILIGSGVALRCFEIFASTRRQLNRNWRML